MEMISKRAGWSSLLWNLSHASAAQGESLPAATIDGFEGFAIAGGGASFDFGEDGDSAVLGDDVDFAKAIAKAGIENFPAEFSEE
jgi:hypothetical protein